MKFQVLRPATLMKSDSSKGFPVITRIRVAYLGFHTLLYFEHQVFLALDKVFCYYDKDTWRNQNKVIDERNIVFRFTRSSMLQVNNIIQVEQVVSTVKKQNDSTWQNVKVYRSHCRRKKQRFLLSLRQFFCPRIAKANWKNLKSPRHFNADALGTWILKAVLSLNLSARKTWCSKYSSVWKPK